MPRNQANSITPVILAVLCSFAGSAWGQPASGGLVFRPDAPERYTVVKGDTLWSIARRFTDSPWRWPELWNLNKDQIRNPHRIMPGDVIVLDRSKAELRLETVKLGPRVRSEALPREEIAPIPPQAIEPFLSRPLVVEAEGLARAPEIVATQEGRMFLSAGERAYVRGLPLAAYKEWHVYRRGEALYDPDTGELLGYEALYLGTANLLSPGDPATVVLTAVTQEVSIGDRLLPAGKPQPARYVPRAPERFAGGRVVRVYGQSSRVAEAGPHSVLVLNRGSREGLEAGHVLALHRLPQATSASGSRAETAAAEPRFAEESYGLVYVFRVFDRVAYALVMHANRSVMLGDSVKKP